MTPKIGVPRLYPGNEIPILYPGECARAHVALHTIVDAYERGRLEIPVTEWIVEPTPGWYGAWLRWRYRIWDRWVGYGPTRIEASLTQRQPSQEKHT